MGPEQGVGHITYSSRSCTEETSCKIIAIQFLSSHRATDIAPEIFKYVIADSLQSKDQPHLRSQTNKMDHSQSILALVPSEAQLAATVAVSQGSIEAAILLDEVWVVLNSLRFKRDLLLV